MEAWEKIMSGAEKLFMRYGLKSVTMDDVAREVSVSKKTLYQYFSDKSELVRKTIERHLHRNDCFAQSIMEQYSHPIEQVVRIAQYLLKDYKSTNPSLLYDMRKYHQDSWSLFCNHREHVVVTHIAGNIRLGQEMGLYRDEVHPDIAARLYLNNFEAVISGEIFNNTTYNFQEKFHQMVIYHLHGICTSEGIEILNRDYLHTITHDESL